MRNCNKPGALPEPLTSLLFSGIADLTARMEDLRTGLGETGQQDRAIISEAIGIFCAAMERLHALASSGEMPRWTGKQVYPDRRRQRR
jgi:hypothetical protein